MKFNLSIMSAAQLDALIERASARLEELRLDRVQRVRSKIERVLKEAGVTLQDVVVLGNGKSKIRKPLSGELDPWLRLRVATGEVAKPDVRKPRIGKKRRRGHVAAASRG